MSHPDALHLQAYFDAEIDAVAAAQLELHLAQCGLCRSQLEQMGRTRSSLRENLTDYRAPVALRAQLQRALDQEFPADATASRKPRRSRSWLSVQFWLGTMSGAGLASAVAAVLAFVLWIPRPVPLTDELISAHVRSLMSSHPIDVVSTDRHTVKPWFAGHADVSPVVADFEPEGYRLMGGRADYLQHQRAAVMIYQHGAHLIDVFSWAATSRSLPTSLALDGYHVACWTAKDLAYCAVSDTGWDELRGLEQLLRDLSARDTP